jgi:Trypsin-co-occurring domain 1
VPRPSVEAVLPGGGVIRVRVAEEAGGMGSVGLGEKLHIEDALAQLGEVASLVRQKLDPAMPTKATVEFGVSFSVQSGKLTSLVFEGKGDASLTVSLEWERLSDTRLAAAPEN